MNNREQAIIEAAKALIESEHENRGVKIRVLNTYLENAMYSQISKEVLPELLRQVMLACCKMPSEWSKQAVDFLRWHDEDGYATKFFLESSEGRGWKLVTNKKTGETRVMFAAPGAIIVQVRRCDTEYRDLN